MQEIIPTIAAGCPYKHFDFKIIIGGIKWVLVIVWQPIGWVLEALIVPHPGQKYIEESRNRAMQFIGHV